MTLSVRPSALAPTLDRPQLGLRPAALFLLENHNRVISDEEHPPYLPPHVDRDTKPAKYPAADPGTQAHIPLPCAPAGKGKSMGTAPLSRTEKEEAKQVRRERLPVLPATRSQCLSFRSGNPCPFVSCRHHLYLDVNPESGAIKVNFPGLERLELAEPWPREPRRVRVDGQQERLVFSGPPRQHAVLDLSLMEDTCSLDVGDRGEKRHDPLDVRRRQIRLEDVGRKMRLTMERARQLLEHAQGELEAKATDGQTIRPMEGDDPNAADADTDDTA